VAKVRLLDPTDPRRRLDRYELIGELASGGMATVFLGRLGGVGGFSRMVAVKQLHPHLASEEEFIGMFLDEARLAAGIHHPNVVPILEVGQSTNGYYLVMEYIEGDTLARIMARSLAMAKPVPRSVLLRVVLDVLSGLHAAHELCDPHGYPVHLVHRDVSPQNVLVGVDGLSRITDFGVAHAASRLSFSRADRLKGKLAYMSPEQARSGNVDRRADVFAMGIILWEVLAAKRLFKGENEAVTLQKVTQEPIPRLSSAAPGVHPALDQVCNRALERDPAQRYKTAAEMAEALERAARAASSGNDPGIASTREVAAYAQAALGEDIAAQRESVRAWLAHSEPSMPTVGGVKPGELSRGFTPRPAGDSNAIKPAYDVTFKMPLDRPASSSRPRAVTIADHRPGLRADEPPSAPGPGRSEQTDAGMPLPPGAPVAAPAPDSSSAPRAFPTSDDDDEEDEGETQLMDRDAPEAQVLAALALRPKAVAAAPPPPPPRPPPSDDGTPSATIGAIELPLPKPSRTPQIVALVVGILIAVGGVVIWWQLDSEKAPAPAESPSAPGAAVPPKPPVSSPTPPTLETAAPPAPPPTTAPSATAVPAPSARWPAPWPKKPGGKLAPAPAPAPDPPPAPKPLDPPKPAPKPDPPKPQDDDANPYLHGAGSKP
jgi:serine/threonine-protein kinase